MNKILKIMRRLRAKDGCPWDRRQTLLSLRQCFIEEAHEVVEAINTGKKELLVEELGDMLCAVGLMVALAEEKKLFDFRSIVLRAEKKMISRHPHVFGGKKAKTAAEALKFFQAVKEAERKERGSSLLADLERGLPALLAAQKIQKKAARIGFDWKKARDVFPKIEEEMKELKAEFLRRKPERVREEIGDLLFTIVNLARKVDVDAETSLLGTNSRFKKRFERMEHLAQKKGVRLGDEDCSAAMLEILWAEAKRDEKRRGARSRRLA